MFKVRLAVILLDLLARHPLFVRIFLRPLANAPFFSRKLNVMFRAFMGSTAFEIHDVDVENGRIGIGGVDEMLFGSEFIHILHEAFGDIVAEEEKERILYDIGFKACYYEAQEALHKGRWAPRTLVPLIYNREIVDRIRSDPLMARFFNHIENMVTRIILNEGGWGSVDFDFKARPIEVRLYNSQEARYLGPADKPVCRFFTGFIAGHASSLLGERVEAREVSCAAMGAPCCRFEIDR
ncbi:MAG: 4-vinyl reductase [Actinobacteria bacterium]|jgi:predicted hydrocarbon binding protein|nr:MAG: 4-vinyl reductase [Actinomycetota bacterium]